MVQKSCTKNSIAVWQDGADLVLGQLGDGDKVRGEHEHGGGVQSLLSESLVVDNAPHCLVGVRQVGHVLQGADPLAILGEVDDLLGLVVLALDLLAVDRPGELRLRFPLNLVELGGGGSGVGEHLLVRGRLSQLDAAGLDGAEASCGGSGGGEGVGWR